MQDIWPENYERFSGRRLTTGTEVSHHKDGVAQGEDRGVPPQRQQKEPLKNKHLNKGGVEEGAAAPGGGGGDVNYQDHQKEGSPSEVGVDNVTEYLASRLEARNIPFTTRDRKFYEGQFLGPVEKALAHEEGSAEWEALRHPARLAADRIVERFAAYKLSYEEAFQDVRRAEAREQSSPEEDGEQRLDSINELLNITEPTRHAVASSSHGSASEAAYGGSDPSDYAENSARCVFTSEKPAQYTLGTI